MNIEELYHFLRACVRTNIERGREKGGMYIYVMLTLAFQGADPESFVREGPALTSFFLF